MLNGNQSNPNPKCSTRKGHREREREREREAREETVSVHLAKPLTGTPGSVGGTKRGGLSFFIYQRERN